MAVPSSGSISWFGLSQEKKVNDYSSSAGAGAIPAISMYDLVHGGNSTGLTQPDVAVTNTTSTDHPDTDAPYSASEWYGYDHDAISGLGGNGSDWHSANFYSSDWIGYSSNGTSALGHSSKTNACNDTTMTNTCASIMWRGTLGNGTTMYYQYGNTSVPLAVLDGSNTTFIRLSSQWSNFTLNNGTVTTNSPATSTGNDAVFQVSSSGIVSNFGTCISLTAYSITSTTYPKGVFACGQTDVQTVYIDDSTPAVGDTIYTSNTGTTTISAGKYGLKSSALQSSTNRWIEVDSSGEITSYNIC